MLIAKSAHSPRSFSWLARLREKRKKKRSRNSSINVLVRYSTSLYTNTSCIPRRLSPLWLSLIIIKRFLLLSWHSITETCTTGSAFPSGAARHNSNLSCTWQHLKYLKMTSCPPQPELIFSRPTHVVPSTVPHLTQLSVSVPVALFWRHFNSPWKHTDGKNGLHPERWPIYPQCGGAVAALPVHALTPRAVWISLVQQCQMTDGWKATISLVWTFPLALLYSLCSLEAFSVFGQNLSVSYIILYANHLDRWPGLGEVGLPLSDFFPCENEA